MESLTIDKADDGTFILRCSRPSKKGAPNMVPDNEVYTAKDMDTLIELLKEELGESDKEEGTEEDKVKKAWNEELGKKKKE